MAREATHAIYWTLELLDGGTSSISRRGSRSNKAADESILPPSARWGIRSCVADLANGKDALEARRYPWNEKTFGWPRAGQL